MNELLLSALSTLYHDPDPNKKAQASKWLETWRRTPEAWNTTDAILHSDIKNVEILFFCSQTLVFKIQQDFEELPQSDLTRLRDSLATLLTKFGRLDGVQIVQKQLAMAFASFCAHAPSSIWSPIASVIWISNQMGPENDIGSILCWMDVLSVLPEEAQNRRNGLHPNRKTQFIQELCESFSSVIQILERYRSSVSRVKLLEVMGSWMGLMPSETLRTHLTALGSLVPLAFEALKRPDDFTAAVDFISELLFLTGNSPDLHEMDQLTDFLAAEIVPLVPEFEKEDLDDEIALGLARLFSDLGCHHEDKLLLQSETATTLLRGILAVTTHPENDVRQHAFDFWERFTYRVVYLLRNEDLQSERVQYFNSIFEALMKALLEAAKLPEEYLEMSATERENIEREFIARAMMDTVGVLGGDSCLQWLLTSLTNACQNSQTDWQTIETVLFAIESIFHGCKKFKENAGALFQAFGSVPDHPVVQTAMCHCIARYNSWFSFWTEQTGVDPFTALIPFIFKNMKNFEWSFAAVGAFCGLCKGCRSNLPSHVDSLVGIYHQMIQAANASHQWTTNAPFVLKEDDAMEGIGAMCYGMTKSEAQNVAASFVASISEGILNDLSQSYTPLQCPSPQEETKLVILVARLKTVFRNCMLQNVAAQLLKRVVSDLLQMANDSAQCPALVEEISTCLRYAVKSSREDGEDSVATFATALPQLFYSARHCGYLYLASEITKFFGNLPSQAICVRQLTCEMLNVVCCVLTDPSEFAKQPDLADDAFLMATRVLNYAPESILTNETLLTQLIDTAIKGMLVQHEDACRSVLRFLIDLANSEQQNIIQSIFLSRGPLIVQILMAGIVAVLPLRILEDVSSALRALLLCTRESTLSLIGQVLYQLPDPVLSMEEKETFRNRFHSLNVQECDQIEWFVKPLNLLLFLNRISDVTVTKTIVPYVKRCKVNSFAERIEEKTLSNETLCWCDGRETWMCAEDIAEIQAAVGAAQLASKTKKGDLNGGSQVASKREEKFVDDDGTFYVWNETLQKYEPQEKPEYDVEEMTFKGNGETMPPMEDVLPKDDETKKDDKSNKKRKEKAPLSRESDPKKTTSVYVTGLPWDTTPEEVAAVFSKCGVLKEDEEGVKVKIYKSKETGLQKGDGLVTYMKRPSVDLATTLLNGTPFRPEMNQTMTVTEAHFEIKGEPKAKRSKTKKPKKNTREEKLLSWGGFDDHLSLHQITVILKHMFHPQEFETGAMTKEELKEEIKTECEKIGIVDRVTIYHENEQGVVSIRFRTEEAADMCVQKMHGRFFAQRQIEAEKWDGFTRYRKANKSTVDDEAMRLEQFSNDLEKS